MTVRTRSGESLPLSQFCREMGLSVGDCTIGSIARDASPKGLLTPLAPFHRVMAAAESGNYAVGYFESWNLESLLAAADAAEEARSPVILGFSGISLTHPNRIVHNPLSVYAAMGLDVCRRLSVPACLLFNESPSLDSVLDSIKRGFDLVMYSDEALDLASRKERILRLPECAWRRRGGRGGDGGTPGAIRANQRTAGGNTADRSPGGKTLRRRDGHRRPGRQRGPGSPSRAGKRSVSIWNCWLA